MNVEIEVVLERLLRWLDTWLNTPNNVIVAQNAVNALDLWLQQQLAEPAPAQPGVPAPSPVASVSPPYVAPAPSPVASASPASFATTSASVAQAQPAGWVPPKLRRKQSSTVGMS